MKKQLKLNLMSRVKLMTKTMSTIRCISEHLFNICTTN